jgi:archaellum component FlaC
MTIVNTLLGHIKNAADILLAVINGDWKGALAGLKNMFLNIFEGITRLVLSNVSRISNYLAGFLDIIGMDEWANSLRSFSEKIASSISKVSEASSAAAEAEGRQSEATKEMVKGFENVKDIVKSTSDEINTLTVRLQGLRSGSIASQDVKKDIEDTESKIKSLKSTLETLTGISQKAADTQKFIFKDGGNIYELVRRTSDEITVLTRRLEGLRNGTVAVKNVHEEIGRVEKRVKDLTGALDTLTGGRDLKINIRAKTGIEAWNESDMFKNIKNPTITPTIDTSRIESGMGDVTDKVIAGIADLSNLVSGAVTSFAQEIGTAFGSGNFNGIGKGLIKSMGQLAQQFGTMLIGMGMAALKLQTLIANPITAIAAGAALVALGAAASAAAGKMVNDYTSSGGYTGGASGYNNITTPGSSDLTGPYRDDYTVEFVIQGENLVGVLNKADQKRNRT